MGVKQPSFKERQMIESLCERGNTLLVNECDLAAWLKLPEENTWLEINYREANYPALNVTTIVATEAKLADHINQNFTGWFVRKCNISGVELDGEYIKEKE